MVKKEFLDDISIVLAGAAGQGIQTIQHLLTHILKLEGYHIFAMKEYMSRVRGGSNSTEIRVCSKRTSAYVDKMDLFLPLNEDARNRYKHRISKETIDIREKDVPMSNIAKELGNEIYSNIVAVGFILALFKINFYPISNYIKNHFKLKGKEKYIKNNLIALRKGYDFGIKYGKNIDININRDNKVKNELYMDGSEAIALGAISGGCNFISSYPMSPSTGVLVNLAKYSKDFDILVEQVEGEIAAINMALGAWYGGARAIVTTSGGGFDLMTEGFSLSGMLETPVVVHIAQRSGPATGLPTRTEQGDLELATYAGHGEYSRIVLAPGDAEEAFYLTQKAMNLADKYQVPVIILTDQFLVDSFYNLPSLNPTKIKNKNYIVKTDKNYKRYKFTLSGISPRGIPSFGGGLISVDSDEHDEEGHITEDHNIRNKMVEKRLKRMELIKNEIEPELIGKDKYKTLVISWGSTKGVVREALEKLNKKNVSFLHFKQVYPLHKKTKEYLRKAKRVIVVENNATGQFSKLLSLNVGINIDKNILKYSGLPFSVEELEKKLGDKL
jgi:2-oxoglutarate/2-oxoacid ferredoxin oxidoreductase subunit alpha